MIDESLEIEVKLDKEIVFDPDYDLDRIIFDLENKIELLSSQADQLDYLLAIGSGLLSGMLDVLWVGDFDLAEGRNIASEQVDAFVQKVARLKSGKDFDLKDAVKYLEKYGLASDANLHDFRGSIYHHLYDFAHHPTIVGLMFSLLSQFTSKAYGTNKNNEFVILDIKESSKKHIGSNSAEKVFLATVNWFFHLVSDMAGSNSTVGLSGGTGLPGPIISLAKEMSVLPIFKNIEIGDDDIHSLISKLYNDKDIKFDLRGELGLGIEIGKQAIPVIANEYMVRSFFFIRRFALEIKEKEFVSLSDLSQMNWDLVQPFNNPTVGRMLTIATGVFTTVDLGEAVVTQKYWLAVNYVGVGRFAVAIGQDVSYGLKSRKIIEIKNMYTEIQKNTYLKIDDNLYGRIDTDMNVDKLSLTVEETEILYNLEYHKTLNDIEETNLPLSEDAVKIIKKAWLNEWQEYMTKGFSSFLQIEDAKLNWYTKEELIEKIEENNPHDTWFRLVLLESMIFEPYYPLGLQENRKGDQVPSKKYKKIQGIVSGYSKSKGDKYLDSLFTAEYYEQGFVVRLRKSYNRVLTELNEVLKGLLTTVGISAVVTVLVVATAGAFSGPIAVALVGSQFAGLSGAALTSASLAYLGGGAIAAGGAGMLGGAVAIVGGGTVLGATVGLGVGGSITSKAMLGKQNTIMQSAKLLVSIREIFLNDEHDLEYSNSVYEQYLNNIIEIEKNLVELRLQIDVASQEEKKSLGEKIKRAEESVEAMKIARMNMNKFISSFEVGLAAENSK